MKKYTNITKYLSFCLFLLIIFLHPKKIFAQVSLSLSPRLTTIEVKPGDEVKTNFFIQNEGEKTLTLSSQLVPFVSSESHDGSIQPKPNLNLDSQYALLFANSQVLGNSNQPIETFTLNPKERKNVFLHILIPDKIRDNDYYFSLLFISNINNNIQNSSRLQARSFVSVTIGSLILLRVGEKKDELLAIDSLHSDFIQQADPLRFRLLVKNNGDHWVIPKISLSITNIINDSVTTTFLEPQVVLEHDQRFIAANENAQIALKGRLFPGIYRARISITYSSVKKPLSKQILFIFVPFEVIVLLALLLWVIYRTIRRVKHYMT